MFKLLHIVGTRPQIIKSAAVSRAIKSNFNDKIEDVKIDTGQHYDEELSDVFYKELEMDNPKVQLSISKNDSSKQLTDILSGINEAVLKFKPNGILVYGDTLSTFAGASIAHTTTLPLFHVEAGLRSYNMEMPEERNRIFADKISTLLFVPTKTAIKNLVKENYIFPSEKPYSINQPGIIFNGDIMFDNFLYYKEKCKKPKRIQLKYSHSLVFLTLHRNKNDENPKIIQKINTSIEYLEKDNNAKVFFTINDRTKKEIQEKNLDLWNTIQKSKVFVIVYPLSYLETIWMLKYCSLVLTDSGGLQKEAYFSGKHCIILRPETEWTELITEGKAILAWHNTKLISEGFSSFFNDSYSPTSLFGNGQSAIEICPSVLDFSYQK
jgi:UDP-GlcNAc3NAcA epimerase